MKGWLRETTQEKDLDTQRRDKLVSLTKLEFQEGRIPMVPTWMTMVLITKVGGECRGIGLV